MALGLAATARAQALPNPYRAVEDWAKLPAGRPMGAVGDLQNPGWEMGIRIGDAQSARVSSFLLYPAGDSREVPGTGAEFVAVDRGGNLYGGEPSPRRIQKYIRVRP